MSKTIQEIMEAYGKTIEASFSVMQRSGSSYTLIASIPSEEIAESRYYFDGALYSSVMRCLEVKLIGNKTSIIKKGLMLDNFNITVTHPEGDRQQIFYGGFHVAEEPEYDAAQNITSVMAYDELYLSMQPYDMTLDWTNGITLKNYLTAILDKINIDYNKDSLALMANANLLITSEKFIDTENDDTESAYTYRDVLDEIAKAAGVSFAFKNSLGGDEYKLYAIKPTDSGYVIDESNLKSVTIGAKYGPVKGVVLSREPQEDNVYYPASLSSTATAVKISNVEIMEDENDDTYRESFIKGIYGNVKDTEYYLYELESYGIAFLNFGDIFTIKACDRENGEIGTERAYKTIFMRTDMTVNTGINEKSKLEAPQATSTDYESAAVTDKTLKKTMLKVDKQNQRITSLVKESESKFSQFEQTVEGIRGEIVDLDKAMTAKLEATAEKAELAYSRTETVEGQIEGVTDRITSLDSQVTSINSELTGINSELDGLDENIADKVTTEVQKDTVVEILAGKVSTKISGNYVSKSDYDSEKEKWLLKTTYNSDKTQTDQKISNAVSRLTTLENAKYITEEQANSLISQSADSISLSVEKSLKIGARNILLNSACFEPASGSDVPRKYSNNKPVQADCINNSSVPSGKCLTASIIAQSTEEGCVFNTGQTIGQKDGAVDKLKPNTTYTLSFWLRFTDPAGADVTSVTYDYNRTILSYLDTTTNMLWYVKYDLKRCEIPTKITANWQKCVLVFTTFEKVDRFYLRFIFGGLNENYMYNFFLSSLKLEEGNIATDWSPSAEDVEQSVNAKINLCVKTDENGKLLSAISVESNMISISSDYFTLTNNGRILCKDLTCASSSESGMSFHMNEGQLIHSFMGETVAYFETTLTSDGMIFETISAASGKGVSLQAGYGIHVTDEEIVMQKDSNHTGLVLNSTAGFGIVQDGKTIAIRTQSDWAYGRYEKALRAMLFTDSALVISAEGGNNVIYLHGQTVACGSIFLENLRVDGSSGKKALYVDTATGKITI